MLAYSQTLSRSSLSSPTPGSGHGSASRLLCNPPPSSTMILWMISRLIPPCHWLDLDQVTSYGLRTMTPSSDLAFRHRILALNTPSSASDLLDSDLRPSPPDSLASDPRPSSPLVLGSDVPPSAYTVLGSDLRPSQPTILASDLRPSAFRSSVQTFGLRLR